MQAFSSKNKLRIRAQFPTATDVRSRTDWAKAGRTVIPGSWAIQIMAPSAWRDGAPVAFREVSVYDISQTEPLAEDLAKVS